MPALRLALSLALIAAAVLPWGRFQDHPHWSAVAWVPYVSPPVRTIDNVLNVALFVPFGASLAHTPVGASFPLIAAAGLAVSVAGELSQVYSHGRVPSTSDVMSNMIGACLGAYLARRRAQRVEERW